MIITHHDFRYEHTLRLGFEYPLGIGSYGLDTEEELLEYVDEYPQENCSLELFRLCQKLEDKINTILVETLKICDNGHFELDWRDDFEIEIHGIDQSKFDESIIQEMNSKLEKLFKGSEDVQQTNN